MAGSKVDLKNPVVGGVLAFLVPGLGHLYQGRTFKGLLYFVCILGTFLFGMRLGNGKSVYLDWTPEKRTFSYLCQFWNGLPALPALMQTCLRSDSAFLPDHVPTRISTRFEGVIGSRNEPLGTVTGTIELERVDRDGFGNRQGELKEATLTTKDGSFPITGLITHYNIDPQVGADRQRGIVGSFQGQADGRNPALIQAGFSGSIPRGFWDYFEAPLLDRRQVNSQFTDLDAVHSELGTRFELGVVYTMIAGLLNILAIYDALGGPFYEEDELAEASTGSIPNPETA